MKKFLLSLFICLCTTLTISAQIQRTFFGLTLGVSTRGDVEKYFRENDLGYKRNDDEYMIFNKEWGGHTWSIISLHFFDDKFYSVHFFDSDITTNKASLELLWDKYSYSFYSKYSQYYVNERSQTDHSFYSDNTTSISAQFSFISEKYTLSIIYTDLGLQVIKLNKDNSDL